MKKIIFLFMLFLLAITISEAKEQCELVSGNGKDIGSEIACGEERFYVIDNDGENTKMLAKYNLYVGLEINQVGETYDNEWDALSYCNSLQEYDATAVWASLSEPGKYYCHTEKKLTYDRIRQSKEAVGLTIKDGKYVIRQVGIVYMSDQFDDYYYDDGEVDENGNLELRYTEIQDYMDTYLSQLKSEGYDINRIELIKLNGFKDLVSKVSGKELDLGLDSFFIDLTSNNLWEKIGFSNFEPNLLHINIKESIPEKYNWIYSTTYWLGSSIVDTRSTDYYDVFMTTLGDLCAVNRGCSGFIKFGAGIRPVLTISNKNISYKIETKTDGNGTIKVEKVNANGGEAIKFTVTPNEGYELGVVKVTDANGNVVYFNDYTFTMPYANVLIEASFLPNNPKTKTFISLLVVILFVVSAIICIKSTKYTIHKMKKTQ